ncbi:MAG TPA: hypothetical protein VMY39_02905 [Planctomycetota bacterium]|nr:hypothetical protein [Planctomycetota bacterium]HUV38530.1 hypothetical protein [Planctomycetota bacterium]
MGTRGALTTVFLACLFASWAPADDAPGGPAAPAPAAPAPARDADASKTADTQQTLTSRKFSIDVIDVPLVDVLEMLTSRAGVGLTVDGRVTAEALRKPLTLELRESSVYAVLHWVFRKRELAWAVDGPQVVVGPVDAMKEEVRREQQAFVARVDAAWRRKAEPVLDEVRLSLDIAGVPLVRAVDLVAERARLNVVWEPDAEPLRGAPTTLKVDDTSARDILNAFARQTKTRWSLEAEALVISAAKP